MSVHKFTDGRKGWYFSVRISGKQYKKERYKNKKMASKIEAQQAEQDFIRSMSNPEADTVTIYELFEEFISTNKGTFKETTLHNYDKFRRNKLTLIPDKRILDLTHIDILAWRNRLINKKNSLEYNKRLLNIAKQLLEYGSIVYNIPSNLQKPLLINLKDYSVKVISQKEKWLKKEEFERLVGNLCKEDTIHFYYYTVLTLLYNTGLRIGELAALTESDIKDNYIQVNKGYERVEGRDIIASPKNNNSIRNVYISESLQALLKEYIERIKPKGTLFHLETEYLNQQRLREVLHKLAKGVGLNETHEIKLHNLRHSHASNLRLYGWNEYEIAQRLGNTPTISSQVYIHADTNVLIEKSMKI